MFASIYFKKIFIRLLIVVFWISAVFLFLFSPTILKMAGLTRKKTLSVFTFAKFIDSECITRFEKETGIKVNVNYYENNDELLVKLKKTNGAGFDIIMPSDYAVQLLIRDGLIKKIDKTRFNFLDKLDPSFVGRYFDPENQYSIPYAWETYKIGYNKRIFSGTKLIDSWKLIFDRNYIKGRIVMNNTPREAILLTAFYLFGSIDNIDDEKLKKIKDVLIEQKEWVEAYSDRRSDYYLSSEACLVAVGSSGEIWRATRMDTSLGFIVPKEGTFLIIDSVVLSAKSNNDENAYKFINFLYKDEIVKHHALKFSIFHTLKDIDFDDYFRSSLKIIRKQAKGAEFFRNVLTDDQMNKVWIDLKVK